MTASWMELLKILGPAVAASPKKIKATDDSLAKIKAKLTMEVAKAKSD